VVDDAGMRAASFYRWYRFTIALGWVGRARATPWSARVQEDAWPRAGGFCGVVPAWLLGLTGGMRGGPGLAASASSRGR
jgi:hypothetical protein